MRVERDKLNANIATTTPARTLESAFQPSADRPVLVSYTLEISVTSTLLGTANRVATLFSDAANPPTTPRASTRNQISGVASTNVQRTQVSALINKGDYVLLSVTATSGTGSVTIIEQTEQVL